MGFDFVNGVAPNATALTTAASDGTASLSQIITINTGSKLEFKNGLLVKYTA